MRLIELFSGSRNDRRVMASLLLLYHFLRNHPFYRDWAAEYITADTETPLDETIWSGLLRQRPRRPCNTPTTCCGTAWICWGRATTRCCGKW